MKINTKNPYIRGYGVNLVDGLYQSDGGLSITDQLIAGTKNEINFILTSFGMYSKMQLE